MIRTVLAPSGCTARGFRSVLTTPVREEDTRTVVFLRGEAAASTSVLCGTLSRVIAFGAGDVVIDLAELEFINSATVRALAVGQRLLERRGRELTLRSPPRPAARMLHTFGLTDSIEAGEAVRP